MSVLSDGPRQVDSGEEGAVKLEMPERKTVTRLGTLWGRPVYVDPFKSEDEEDLFLRRFWQALGVVREEEE